MPDNDKLEPDVDEDEPGTRLPDLDVTDGSGDAVKGGVPKVDKSD